MQHRHSQEHHSHIQKQRTDSRQIKTGRLCKAVRIFAPEHKAPVCKICKCNSCDPRNHLHDQSNQQADRITSIITNLNDDELASENYSAIAQLQDNIELKVAKDSVVTQINMNKEGVRIKGNLISLDGDTSVNGYFWARAVQAKSIDADKLNVTSLSALTANFGEFTTAVSGKGYMKVKGSLIEVYDNNNQLRVRLGIW